MKEASKSDWEFIMRHTLSRSSDKAKNYISWYGSLSLSLSIEFYSYMYCILNHKKRRVIFEMQCAHKRKGNMIMITITIMMIL